MKEIRQFTATAYILEKSRVLLIYHKKLQKWLPPGGHIEPNELPSEAAIREAKEETGLDVTLILQENIWIDKWNGKSFPRPYMCLLEEIPTYGNEAAHQHMDFIFVARPLSNNIQLNHQETNGIRWFSFDEIRCLKHDVEIYEETYKVIEHLFSHDKLFPSYPEYVRE